ncbi:hypothetical protein IH980_00005, partial [Patescibacteria group bacterium]|nr:hypothetical protein [Patescibacteria group bacterium]
EFSQLYLQTDEDIQFFRNMLEAYGNDRAVIRLATNAILKQDLSRELVLKFPERVPGLMSPEMEQARWQVFASLDTLLTGESDFNFLEQLATNYEGSGEDAYQVLLAIVNKGLSRDLALKFPKKAKALMSDEMKPMRRYVFENADTLLHEESDLQFLTRLVGKHGKTADQIVRDYLRCLQEGAIERSEKDLVLEFAEVFRVISPTTLVAYKEAKAAGGGEVFLTGLRDLAEKMISTESVPEKDRETPYYDEILRSVYANNAGNWGSHKLNATCTDRSRDLDQFSFESRYEIDLLSAADVSVREGETLDREKIKELEENVYALAREMEEQGFDSEKAKEALASEVEEKLRTVQERGGLTGVDLEKITSTEERLFLLLVDAVYGEGSIDTADLKRLVIRYEFAYFEDIRDYIEGTNDRVGRARNPDYGLLTELHSFYSDRIKEVNRGLVRAALENPEVAKTFPQYFEQLSKDAAIQKRKEIMSRQRVDRLGMSDSFIEQIRRSLRGKTGRDYTPEYVRRLIARYESSTGGLREKTTVSKKKRTKAFYGQLRAQREKTFRVMQELTGEEVDPQDVHLDEINLAELIEGQVSIEKGRYDEEQFASYTVQRFLNVFADEREAIESQLDKFKTASGKGREVLNAYFTKSKESANARMVGGVCVAGDNPDRSGRKNMWDMENYFQLVFQDPETYRCQGLVLLHHFTDDEGKRILAASLNPSSTYVLSVDEEALFAGIMGLLVEFTEGNEFDMIVTSSNRTIRTNRTGGAFEKAIEERIRKIGKEYRFAEPKRFSFQNQYHLQEMDVVWEKGE